MKFDELPVPFVTALVSVCSLSSRRLKPVSILSASDRSLVVDCLDCSCCSHCIIKIQTSFKNWTNEVNCLRAVQHQNIVSLVDAFPVNEFWCLILEKVKGVCLISELVAKKKIEEAKVAKMVSQLLSSLIELHSHGWVHRDLKPDNIMFDPQTGKVKLIDFEFATKVSKWKNHHTSVGTFEYSAPEVRKGKYKGPEADVWSLGVTVFALVTGCYPFSNNELEEKVESYRRPPGVSEECEDFLKRMLEKNTKRRAKLRELRDHKWLKMYQ